MKRIKTRLFSITAYLVLSVIAVIAIFPILYIFLAAFRTNQEFFEYALPFTWKTLIPQQWTVDNFQAIFSEFHFGRSILNTCLVIAVLLPLSLILSALGGFTFAFFEFRLKKVLFAICLISFMIPTDAIAIPLYKEVSQMRLINTYWALIFPSAASGLAMFLFTQFFKDIPKSILEAGRIDGANWLQIFFGIVLPLSVPVSITAGLMIFINEWNNFFWPLLVARNEEVRTIQVALAYFEDENQVYFSYIFAASAISALVPVCLFLPLQKYFVQGITSGGVKG